MMATVREGVMRLPDADGWVNRPERIESFAFDFRTEWIRNKFLSVIPKEEKVKLSSANVVVAGGAGVGTRENFGLLRSLAEALGGEVAGSRAAVDFAQPLQRSRDIGGHADSHIADLVAR